MNQRPNDAATQAPTGHISYLWQRVTHSPRFFPRRRTGSIAFGSAGASRVPGVADVCVGKTAVSPCFYQSGGPCNAAGTCQCGIDLDGNVTCRDRAFCNDGGPECTSNADCEAITGKVGSVCFSSTSCCAEPTQTGCTIPCST